MTELSAWQPITWLDQDPPTPQEAREARRALIIGLRKMGMTQAAIAAQVGVSQATVSAATRDMQRIIPSRAGRPRKANRYAPDQPLTPYWRLLQVAIADLGIVAKYPTAQVVEMMATVPKRKSMAKALRQHAIRAQELAEAILAQ